MFKNDGPVVVAFVIGSLIVLSYFLNIPVLQTTADQLVTWLLIIAGFALGLGVINLLQVHSQNISRRGPKWFLSIWLIAVMVVTIAVGVTQGTSSALYSFMYTHVYSALGATTFALHAFFLPAAAYRAFRITNVESGIFLLSGILVMLGQVGIGAAIWAKFPLVKSWVMDIPNSSAMRGVTITAALGLASTGIRIILGLDKTYLGSSNSE